MSNVGSILGKGVHTGGGGAVVKTRGVYKIENANI